MPPGADPPTPLAYLNSSFLPQAEARLPLHDAGFVFGATVTDLCRTFRHRLFRLADHLTRFRQSCTLARVPQPVPDEELTRLAEQLVAHNAALLPEGGDLALVLFATPGPIGYYLGEPGGPGDGPPTLGMHTFPLPWARYRRLFREGARLVVPDTRHVPPQCVDPQIKQRSRLHWWLAEQEARQADPAASALLLDADGYVTETAAANFLVVRAGTVLTPPRPTVLGGISLLTARELCVELGIPFAEQSLTVADCVAGQEAMLASTPYCLAGVQFLNGAPLPWPGEVHRRLLDAWGRRVGLDIGRQILAGP
jgi:branched-subunit amino acid aminotransferase/4-amino-4-deoxychorismate lyase